MHLYMSGCLLLVVSLFAESRGMGECGNHKNKMALVGLRALVGRALMGRALMGPLGPYGPRPHGLGPCGLGPYGPPWAPLGRALIGLPLAQGLPGLFWAGHLLGLPGRLWAGPLWGFLGPHGSGPYGPP